MKEVKNFGARICALRKARGLSQEEFAYKIGVVRQTVYKWEANAMKPGSEQLAAIAELFNVSADYLLFGTEIGTEALADKNPVKIESKPSRRAGLYIGILTVFLLATLLIVGIGLYAWKPNRGDAATTQNMMNPSDLAMGIGVGVALLLSLFGLWLLLRFIKKKRIGEEGGRDDRYKKEK